MFPYVTYFVYSRIASGIRAIRSFTHTNIALVTDDCAKSSAEIEAEQHEKQHNNQTSGFKRVIGLSNGEAQYSSKFIT